MATVLMLGRPPPANPYTRKHPASAALAALAATAPQRRSKRGRRVHRNHREFETSWRLRKDDPCSGRERARIELGLAARQDFSLAPPFRLEQAHRTVGRHVIERVPTLDEPPDGARWRAGAVDVRLGPRGSHDAERGPQHRDARHQRVKILLWVGPDRGIAHDDG